VPGVTGAPALQDRRRRERERAEFVRGLLWGALLPDELLRGATDHAVDLGREYLAVRARPARGIRTDEVGRAYRPRPTGAGLGAVVDGDLVGFVAAAPAGPVPGVSGLGPPRPPERLRESAWRWRPPGWCARQL
jgi:hypothetical protein